MTLKERCTTVMVRHLTKHGYPNMDRSQILSQVKNMWNALDEAGLMPEIKASGHTYDSFCAAAVGKAQEAAFDEFIEGIAHSRTSTPKTKPRRTK